MYSRSRGSSGTNGATTWSGRRLRIPRFVDTLTGLHQKHNRARAVFAFRRDRLRCDAMQGISLGEGYNLGPLILVGFFFFGGVTDDGKPLIWLHPLPNRFREGSTGDRTGRGHRRHSHSLAGSSDHSSRAPMTNRLIQRRLEVVENC